MASDKYKDKYADVWSQMPISGNVLDLRGRAVEMTQEGRKSWDDMNKFEPMPLLEPGSGISRDAGIDDMMQPQQQQPFGTVPYNESRPQSLLSEGTMRDYKDTGTYDDSLANDLAEVRRGNSGVEEREAVPYDTYSPGEMEEYDDGGEQSFAKGGPVLPEDTELVGMKSEGEPEAEPEEAMYADEATEQALDDQGDDLTVGQELPDGNEEGDDDLDLAEIEQDPLLVNDEEDFSTNGPTFPDEGDGEEEEDEVHQAHPAVRAALDWGRQMDGNGQGTPESAERGVIPPPDMKMALAAATEDPAAEEAARKSKLADYVAGKGAMSPDEVREAESQVDPTGTMDPDQLRVSTVAYLQQNVGPQAAFAYMQNARQQFDISRNFAAAAAAGTPEKPADLTAAANAANRAFSYLPDGRNVTFIPTRNGMKVRVA